MVRRAASVLALVTVLALAACAGPAQSDGDALMPTPTQSVDPESVETDEPSAEPSSEVDPASGGETDGAGEAEPEPSIPTINAADLVTVANSAAFATLMSVSDSCSPSIETFARDFRGEPLQFNGTIAAFDSSSVSSSHMSIQVRAGDQGVASPPGPVFQFRDVKVSDIGLSGSSIPGMLNVGDNVIVTAYVISFDTSKCFLLLDPVTTVIRP